MKKIIITLVFVLACMSSFAQTFRYRTNSLAVGYRDSYGNISWGDWNRCNVLITIDFDNDYIKVFSEKEQNFVITNSTDEYIDKSGGSNIDCNAVDEEGIECTVRLRIQKDGTAQLYAFYSNVAWVYSGLERR